MKKGRKLLEEARKRFNFVVGVEKDQRRQETEDLEFQVPELQWPEAARVERQGGVRDGMFIPARPMLTIPRLEQPISNVLNQQRRARLGIDIHPISQTADDDTAGVFQGIYNAIQRDSRANVARSWAFNRAVRAGRGCYRINTRYANDPHGDPFDQVITIERILHQESVYFDPSAQEPDFSDAGWAFVSTWVPRATFEQLHPNAKIPTSEDFGDEGAEDPEWVSGDGEDAAIRVVEYFAKEWESETLHVLAEDVAMPDGTQLSRGQIVAKRKGTFYTLDDRELGEVLQVDPNMERERRRERVFWSKLTAVETLEGPVEWNGRYIPLVMVLGRELIPFDKRRRFMGMVRPGRDPQEIQNYAVTQMVERAALEPKAPYVGDPKQFEGFERFWEQANTRNYPYLPANLVIEGQKLPAPARSEVNTSAMTPMMALAQMAEEGIQAATQTPSPALGRYDNRERSGKAIERLQQESDLSNSDYGEQLVTVSMTYEAKVVLDMIPRIYDRPGRLIRTLDDDDATEQVMINQPYIVDPRTKQPVPVVEGAPLPPADPGSDEPPKVKHYDLAKGVYGVAVTIGRSYQTQRQESAVMLERVIEKAPDLMQVIGDRLFKAQDWPGAEEIADRLQMMVRQNHPEFFADDEDGPSKASLMQQVQQLQSQLQEAQPEQMKQQADTAKARLDAQTKMAIESMKTDATQANQRLKAETDERLARLEAQTKLLVAILEQEGVQTGKLLDHAAAMEQKDVDFEVGTRGPVGGGLEE